ncbi:tetratricopeptide repeat protein [bacterium]|nr:tetratricopeptide repeat protein [bacterium]
MKTWRVYPCVCITIIGLLLLITGCQKTKQWENKRAEVERLFNEGKYSEVLKLAEENVELARELFGAEHLNVARSMNNLAMVYKANDRLEDAIRLHEQALDIKKKILKPDDPSIANSLNNIGVLYAEQGELIKSEPYFLDALRTYVKDAKTYEAQMISTLENLVFMYTKLGDREEAEKYEKHLLQLRKAATPEEETPKLVVG